MNDTEQIKKRFLDLADKAYSRDICTFTNFLSLSEASIYYEMQNELNYIDVTLFGGADFCERKMIRFGNLCTDFPINCIHITPALKKFSDDLTHRDFLGSLINLGIKRETLGDILVLDREAYVFCTEGISDFIIENLTKVKHTSIKCSIADTIPESSCNKILEKEINVASLRLDAVIGEVYRLSRKQSQCVIQEKRVFVNGRNCENNSYNIAENDQITVRGMGKFIFSGEIRSTKKGRYFITVHVFV